MTSHWLSRQAGTTLIEALIAAVVIAVGLLGTASLFVNALQASTSAEHRTIATDLAWSLADRIRANQKADNNYITTLTGCPSAAAIPICFATPGGSLAASKSCTPDQIATADLEEIFCAPDTGIYKRLPNSSLSVTCADNDLSDSDACSPGSQIRIRIRWATRNDVLRTGGDSISMTVINGTP